MKEYQISVLTRSNDGSLEWNNHVVYSKTRKDAVEAITDYFCGYNILSIVFNKGVCWDKD